MQLCHIKRGLNKKNTSPPDEAKLINVTDVMY